MRHQASHLDRLSSNLSNADRVIRIGLGLLALGAPLLGWLDGLAATASLIFAWVPLVTAVAGWCPFYSLFGISTRKT